MTPEIIGSSTSTRTPSARPKTAVVLVLDHSGSMSDDAGDGTPKVAKLREAATDFVNAMLDGDAVSVVRFDDTAQTLMPVSERRSRGDGRGG